MIASIAGSAPGRLNGGTLKRLNLLIVIVFAALALTACQEDPRQETPVLLKVGDRSVTLDQFQGEFRHIIPDDQALSATEQGDLKRSFLRQIIDRELTLGEAQRLGIDVSAEELELKIEELRGDYPPGEFEKILQQQGMVLEQWRQDLQTRLQMEKVVRHQVYERVAVEEAEVESYYLENRKEFDRPEQVRARQIVLATEAEGQRVLGMLRQGEHFEAMAREHSLSPDGEQGGDLGFFARGEMPPQFEEVVFTLPTGRLSDLVKTDYGYHIFRVEEKRRAQRLKLEEVRSEIETRLRVEKEQTAYRDWLLALGSQVVIEVDWSQL